MGKFENMKNSQREVFFRLSLLSKMIMQRETSQPIKEEVLYKEIIENLLQQPDVCLLKDQNLYYLVDYFDQNKRSFNKEDTLDNHAAQNTKVEVIE